MSRTRPSRRRPKAAVRGRAAPRPALLVVGHGSRLTSANRLLGAVARDLRRRFPGRIVEACYLEAARPRVLEAIAGCVRRGAARILLVPYFLYLGGHVRRDLPDLAARGRRLHAGVRIRIAPHLGADGRLVSVAAARALRGLRAARWE